MNIVIDPFTMFHDGITYKISLDREDKEGCFLNAENVETGEIQNFKID